METESPFGSTRRVQTDDHELQIIQLKALTLQIVKGRGAGRKRVFDAPTIRVGKGDNNDFIIQDEAVSRNHLKIVVAPDGIRLLDLESTNGTFVNGVRVQQALIEPGMNFRIGETEIAVEPQTRELTAAPSTGDSLGHLVGSSSRMREVYGLLGAVADSTVTVLLLGESGTGKEATAKTLHELSGRSGPFVVFDCASTSPDLIRSELFGHEEGAFTGAARSRDGAFRLANGGTLFIDELGELPVGLQPNLLRVLESREVQPLGKDRAIPIDVRVVTATNKNLEEMVREGTFREDLYHRIAVIPINLPPLRERPSDIPLLVEHMVRAMKLDCRFSDEAFKTMSTHDWQGNVRSLRNVVERCGVLCRGRIVQPEDLQLKGTVNSSGGLQTGGKTLAEIEKEAILSVLEAAGGLRRETARRLGISITTLRRKLKDYGVSSSEDED